MFKFGQKYDKKLDNLIKILPQNGNVLDIGCGAGGNSMFLAGNGFGVTCIDTDEEAINEIQTNYSNINAICDNVLNFKFTESCYDLILALNVLNFFKKEETESIICNMVKSLKEGGLIYVQMFSVNDPSYNKFLGVAEKSGGENTFFSKKTQSFMHFFTKQELINYFDKNTIVELEELSIKDNHPPQGEHEHGIIKALIRKH